MKVFLKNNILESFDTDVKFKSAKTWVRKEQRTNELLKAMEKEGIQDDHNFVEIVTYGYYNTSKTDKKGIKYYFDKGSSNPVYGCEIWWMGS